MLILARHPCIRHEAAQALSYAATVYAAHQVMDQDQNVLTQTIVESIPTCMQFAAEKPIIVGQRLSTSSACWGFKMSSAHATSPPFTGGADAMPASC